MSRLAAVAVAKGHGRPGNERPSPSPLCDAPPRGGAARGVRAAGDRRTIGEATVATSPAKRGKMRRIVTLSARRRIVSGAFLSQRHALAPSPERPGCHAQGAHPNLSIVT
mmetsp:Transcript_103950/g.299213  ORF Transcript_103950/g.299213 Transcript_103950/m.299213 type:complete len:110 (-) Transcript_103950:67-396(-)